MYSNIIVTSTYCTIRPYILKLIARSPGTRSSSGFGSGSSEYNIPRLDRELVSVSIVYKQTVHGIKGVASHTHEINKTINTHAGEDVVIDKGAELSKRRFRCFALRSLFNETKQSSVYICVPYTFPSHLARQKLCESQ